MCTPVYYTFAQLILLLLLYTERVRYYKTAGNRQPKRTKKILHVWRKEDNNLIYLCLTFLKVAKVFHKFFIQYFTIHFQEKGGRGNCIHMYTQNVKYPTIWMVYIRMNTNSCTMSSEYDFTWSLADVMGGALRILCALLNSFISFSEFLRRTHRIWDFRWFIFFWVYSVLRLIINDHIRMFN